ncbi:MAG TPA: ABC transporter permease [Anaerolineaceae bacterium]|jgi:ribose transport system permease protein|nr:ABC transporter permease [Anaerolineaceae bacterium]
MKTAKNAVRKNAVFGILIILFLTFAFLKPSFLKVDNLLNLLVQSTILGIVGFGLAIIMMAGEIDLSYAGAIPLEGAIFANLLQKDMGVWPSLGVSFLAGITISLVISQLVTRLKLVSYVTTTSMYFLLQGIWYAYTGGENVYFKEKFNRDLIFGSLAGIPKIVIFFLLLFVILYFLTEHTSFGIRLRAVGEDPEAAKTMGVNSITYKTAGFILGGFIFAIGAFFSTAKMSGALATSGANMLMPVMTVAFVGQTFLGMGRPNIPGVFLAALMMAMIDNAFVLMNSPFWAVPIANGIILILAIFLANVGKRDIIQIKL